MIHTQALTKHFDDFVAVAGVSLDVKAGSVLALLGPNGAGKTTTVRMLTSILKPTSGRACVAGYDVVAQPAEVRRSVGVLTEQHGLYDRMAADEYLDFFGDIYGLDTRSRQASASQLLEMFGLQSFKKRRVGEYSKGMRQKLALTRALLHNPPVLLLDEPTSAMDPESSRMVRDALQNLRSSNRTILLCTHNLAEAEELADQIAIIRRGQIIAHGSPEELKQQMLGDAEYEVRLGLELNGHFPQLPAAVTLTQQGQNWLRFRTPNPVESNPLLIQCLFEQGLPVYSLHEVPRNLEQVYLKAMNHS